MEIVKTFQKGLAWISSVFISSIIDTVSNFVKNNFPFFCKNKSNPNLSGRVSVADANQISQLAIVPYGFFQQQKGLNFGSSEGLESNKDLKMATKLEKELIADAKEISQLAIVHDRLSVQPECLNFGPSEGLESNENFKMPNESETEQKVTGNTNRSKKTKFRKAPELNGTRTSHPQSADRQFRGKV